MLACKLLLFTSNFTLCSFLIILFQVFLEEPAVQSSIPCPWKVQHRQLGVEWEHQARKQPADSCGLWPQTGLKLDSIAPWLLGSDPLLLFSALFFPLLSHPDFFFLHPLEKTEQETLFSGGIIRLWRSDVSRVHGSCRSLVHICFTQIPARKTTPMEGSSETWCQEHMHESKKKKKSFLKSGIVKLHTKI